jgi:hypothetical protein
VVCETPAMRAISLMVIDEDFIIFLHTCARRL